MKPRIWRLVLSCVLALAVVAVPVLVLSACDAELDPAALPDGLQPLPLPGELTGLPPAPSPTCAAVQAGQVVLNEYLVRPGGLDLDGDGKSNGRDEVIELVLDTHGQPAHLAGTTLYVDGALRGEIKDTTCFLPQHLLVLVGNTTGLGTWAEGADEVRLDHLLKLPDTGASLEMRTADNQLLFRHQYAPETAQAASSWTRGIDGDGAASWTRQVDLGDGHGRAHSIGLCNNGQPACACLASAGMDCAASVTPTAP